MLSNGKKPSPRDYYPPTKRRTRKSNAVVIVTGCVFCHPYQVDLLSYI